LQHSVITSITTLHEQRAECKKSVYCCPAKYSQLNYNVSQKRILDISAVTWASITRF